MRQDGGRSLWNRRELLHATGLTAVTVALAGCEDITDREFAADAVVLPPAAPSSLGFTPVVEQPWRREIERTVGGQDVTATIESFVSVYAQTDGEVTAAGADSAPRLLRYSGGTAPFDGTTDRLLAGPATAFGTVGGTLPFLRDGVVDPRGVVLFTPAGALSGAGLDANEVLAVAHRSAFSAGPLVPTEAGVSFADSAFFPNSVFATDAEWFPNGTWVPPGDETRSTVAFFPGPGGDSEAIGAAGSRFEAGTPLAATYVAAPADVFFDTGVSVTDPDRLRAVLGTDVPTLDVVGLDRAIDDAGVVVFSDGERGVPLAYVPGETLFPATTFFPDSFFLSESLLNPESLALFFPSAPVSSVPDPFTVVDPETTLSPSGAMLFPDSTLLPMETNAHPATSAELPPSFPRSFLFPDETFSPTDVLHLPGDFGFSAELFESAGTTVTHARSATAEQQRAARLASAPLSLGVLSTPVARVADGSIEWDRGPTRLGTETTSLLGDAVTMETYAGILAGSDPSVVYLYLVRVENGSSVVVSVGVHGFDVSDTDRPFVGADGYVSQDRLDRFRSVVTAADEALTVR